MLGLGVNGVSLQPWALRDSTTGHQCSNALPQTCCCFFPPSSPASLISNYQLRGNSSPTHNILPHQAQKFENFPVWSKKLHSIIWNTSLATCLTHFHSPAHAGDRTMPPVAPREGICSWRGEGQTSAPLHPHTSPSNNQSMPAKLF